MKLDTERAGVTSVSGARRRWLLYFAATCALAGLFVWNSLPASWLLLAAALLAILWAAAGWLSWPAPWRKKWLSLAGVCALLAVVAGAGGYFYIAQRYAVAEVMEPAVTEYGHEEYPENPSRWSTHYGDYNGRKLTLVQKDQTHFDFVLEPLHPFIAKIEIRNVDVSLMTPSLPEWSKEDAGLRRIALTDRQWNRQQVRFPADSPQIVISGGDGFEKEHIYTVELAKNCLNAGLWEIILFEKDELGKAPYYQNWFTFPLGQYKRIFELNTGFDYRDHWYYLEHWVDPVGTLVPMEKLREVLKEREAKTQYDPDERVIVHGEQVSKRRTMIAEDVRSWKDFYDGRKVQFASFLPPGAYRLQSPRDTEYERMDRFEKAIYRKIKSPASEAPLSELELVFSSSTLPGQCRFIVSGFDLAKIPQLPVADYPKGYYMPMGIGTPPFYQAYEELLKNHPSDSPFVSVLLDEQGGWIDHHSLGIDGPVMHRDENDAGLLHLYLLSYERHSLIGHFVLEVAE